MHRISTNATLFLKLFLPLFWLVFFGCLVLAIWLVKSVSWGILEPNSAKTAMTLLYLLFALFIYFTLFQLQRIEVDDHFLYVYSYFRSRRYPFHQIESIREYPFGPLRIARIRLKSSGTFGRNIYFIESPGRVTRQRTANDQLDQLFLPTSF